VLLFTWVLIREAMRLPGQHFEEDILRLFCCVLISSYFSLGGQLYGRTDGMVLATPLSPFIASFFIKDFVEVANKPLCWFHYMDVGLI
jgi:hypothetical protein